MTHAARFASAREGYRIAIRDVFVSRIGATENDRPDRAVENEAPRTERKFMLTVSGILLLMGGAILTFAVDRQVEGVDVQLVGWILMAAGGMALIVAVLRGAAVGTVARQDARYEEMLHVPIEERRSA